MMLCALWNDESGFVLSGEVLLLGSVAVVGVLAGLATVGYAVRGELEESALAIRSVDQSFTIPESKHEGVWTAGSEFEQKPVEESRKELRDFARKKEAELKRQHQRIKAEQDKAEKKQKAKSDPKKSQKPEGSGKKKRDDAA